MIILFTTQTPNSQRALRMLTNACLLAKSLCKEKLRARLFRKVNSNVTMEELAQPKCGSLAGMKPGAFEVLSKLSGGLFILVSEVVRPLSSIG